MTTPRRIAFFAAVATLTSLSVFIACGLDITESGPANTLQSDGRAEASLPPTTDGRTDPQDTERPDQVVPLPGCPTNLPGSPMVGSPDGGFCIDSFEVSAGEYAMFVDASATLDAGVLSLPSFCRLDAGFAPANSASAPNQPVMYVNFCDAVAYCQWAGKRLCGSQEWSRACTADFTRSLPYGDGPDATACNVGKATSPFAHAEGGVFAGCEGGFDGVFDMVGNTAEWVNECSTDGGACSVLGGAWYSNLQSTSCGTREPQSPLTKTTSSYGVGFRCCAR